ncbi:kinase-like protein [Marasmius fiardii PR-910]|nr:kinase-like protein [Marasmius fiardii PR-910]
MANGRCHLADFGLAVTTAETTALFNSTTSSLKGSLRWMAPELFKFDNLTGGEEKPNDLARDVYAYACTMLEIITGKPPFSDMIDTAVMFQVAVNSTRPNRPSGVRWCPVSPYNIWMLIQQCWQQIDQRPMVSGVHEYLERLVCARRDGVLCGVSSVYCRKLISR